MAGLYIHVPFCASRCIYCGFYSTTRTDLRQQYVDALCREMELRSLPPSPSEERGRIDTVYIGGGTPSQLTEAQLRQLFIYINKVYGLTGGQSPCEVTIEVNPDDVSAEYAAALQLLGINRVSMGAQTFDDQRLGFLRRRHTAAQVSEAVGHLRAAGIRNISVDLMYGFPGETQADWHRDIDAALALGVEHLSAYCLMIEEGTPLQHMGIAPPDEETERAMYYALVDRLTAAGYEHYEISNFARPGRRSRHNSGYWHDVPYLGLGAAAHSYVGNCRQWNVSDIHQYIDAINEEHIPCEQEMLDADTYYNDCIATALRTSDGLDLGSLSDRHRRHCMHEARPFLSDGLLQTKTSPGDCPSVRLVLTRRGLFVSDMVMAGLMLV